MNAFEYKDQNSGLILPVPNSREKTEKRQKEVKSYREQYCACPNCGSAVIETTCVGVVQVGSVYEDKINRADCKTCG